MMNYMICLDDRDFTIIHETSSVREVVAKIHQLTNLSNAEIIEEMKEALTHPRCASFIRYNLKTAKKAFGFIVDFEKVEA